MSWAPSRFVSKAMNSLMEGVIGVNKPQGISSAQVLRDLQDRFNDSKFFAGTIKAEYDRVAAAKGSRRKLAHAKNLKMGHGGTLDPLATGVLIVGIGSGTKELQNFLGCTKQYETTILFGAATDSYDIVGKVVARKPYEHVTREGVLEAISRLRAKKTQKPPIFSALRHEGKRFYEYAREGKQLPIEIPERPAEIHDIELLEWLEPGSHAHKIPETDAEEEMKTFAQKEFGGIDTPVDAGTAREPSVSSPERKRKLEETIDSVVQEGPDAKKHQSDEATLMSGALGERPTTDTKNAQHAAGARGPPACRIRMTVSTGFYIRSFAHDLGREVNSLALMATLVRTRQEKFELGKNVLNWEDVDDEETWSPKVESLLEAWRERQKSDPVKKAAPRNEETNRGKSRGQRPSRGKEYGRQGGGPRRNNSPGDDRQRRNTSSEGE